MNTEQKLEQFAEREVEKYLANLIIEDGNNKCLAFGAYYIKNSDNGVEVRNFSDSLMGCFSNKRSALGYCTADKFNRLNLALQIKNLDAKKQILANDLHCSRNMASRSRSENFRETVDTKMQPKVEQYQAVCRELEKCVNSAKYLQIKGFQHETARVFSN